MLIQNLTIIGVGLIGGSLALSLKKAGMVRHVTGYGRSAANLKKALALGVVDKYSQDIKEAVKGADIIFLAVPMGAMADVFAQIKQIIPKHCIITDGGSVKMSVIEDCGKVAPSLLTQFVPGHPIAGTEKSGAEAAFDRLYQDKRIILTPTKDVSPDKINMIEQMWQACGANVSLMDAKEHDFILAATSHLPHLLAFNLVEILSRQQTAENILDFAAGGFRDFTRIASSNPTMWRDICITNADAMLSILDEYRQGLNELTHYIKHSEEDKLLRVFDNAKKTRDKYIDRERD